MTFVSPAIVACEGYCPAAIRDLKLSTTSFRTSGIWLAAETRLENESGEKLITASSEEEEEETFAADEEFEVLAKEETSCVVVTLLICINRTSDIGLPRPLIRENLEEVSDLFRFIGVGIRHPQIMMLRTRSEMRAT